VILRLVIAAEEAGELEQAASIYAAANQKLQEDIIRKTDGLQGIGANARDDFFTNQEAQDIVYPDLIVIRDYLDLR
jgi:hypothetical protein